VIFSFAALLPSAWQSFPKAFPLLLLSMSYGGPFLPPSILRFVPDIFISERLFRPFLILPSIAPMMEKETANDPPLNLQLFDFPPYFFPSKPRVLHPYCRSARPRTYPRFPDTLPGLASCELTQDPPSPGFGPPFILSVDVSSHADSQVALSSYLIATPDNPIFSHILTLVAFVPYSSSH